MDIFFAIFTGLVSGIIFEKLATTPWKGSPTLVPSLLTHLTGKTFHFHHWIFYAMLSISTLVLAWKTDRLFHPAVIFIFFFLFGATSYDLWKFNDWYRFIY